VARGGCLIESDIGAVDARVATRWERATAAMGMASASLDERLDQPLAHTNDKHDGDAEEAAS
jgi:flagellar assembly protein FliH